MTMSVFSWQLNYCIIYLQDNDVDVSNWFSYLNCFYQDWKVFFLFNAKSFKIYKNEFIQVWNYLIKSYQITTLLFNWNSLFRTLYLINSFTKLKSFPIHEERVKCTQEITRLYIQVEDRDSLRLTNGRDCLWMALKATRLLFVS